MGVRILTDRQSDYPSAILYCSTSDWAFGPVFGGSDTHNAEERAESFLRFAVTDVRRLTERDLQALYSTWLAQEDAQWSREAEAERKKDADEEAALDAEDARLKLRR